MTATGSEVKSDLRTLWMRGIDDITTKKKRLWHIYFGWQFFFKLFSSHIFYI